MLEALISTRPRGETNLKKRGDVLVIRLKGSPWGGEERRYHKVVDWPIVTEQDAAILAALNKEVSPENLHPSISYPFADHDVITGNIKTRSTTYVDISAMAAQLKSDVLDATKELDVITSDKFSRAERAK